MADNEKCGCEIRCGCWRSKRLSVNCLSCCANIIGVLVFFSIASFFIGLVASGLFSVVVSTLEKRFKLRSSETGFISSTYDIAACVSIPVISYIGGRGHKPLWIGTGIMLFGLASVVFFLPHVIAPAYSVTGAADMACGNSSSKDCGRTNLRAYRGFFIVSQMLQGIGAAPITILGTTYLDENVQQTYSSTVNGVLSATSSLGPGVGYFLGGFLLQHYTNINETISITQNNVFWVGNWWIGFLVAGIFMVMLAVPILMLPEQLPGATYVQLDRENEMHLIADADEAKDQHFGTKLIATSYFPTLRTDRHSLNILLIYSLRDAPRCIMMFIKNPTMMLISLAGCTDSGLLIGMSTFTPKYISSMFGFPASAAGLYVGVITIITSFSGNLISGFLISKLKLSVSQMIKMCVACSLMTFACFFVFAINCDNPKIAGVNVPYPGQLEIRCAGTSCGCSVDFFNPVCGSDNLTYLSFCDAGCKPINEKFLNCSHIVAFDEKEMKHATATQGKCEPESCTNFVLFIAFLGIGFFFSSLMGQPVIQIALRCVPFHQRSFALGMQSLFVRALGSIPLLIVYGKVLDLSCLVWGKECGQCGTCEVYDNRTMSQNIVILTAVLKGTTTLFLIATSKVYRPPTDEN